MEETDMTNFEMVERLRANVNVSYEEAKAALEASDWDLLEAMVLLEKEGKVDSGSAASYTTREDAHAGCDRDAERFKAVMGRVGEKLKKGVDYLMRNTFEISRKDKVMLSLPVLVLLVFLLLRMWPVLIVLIVGLFFGFRYAFRGPDLGKKPINDAMDKAAGVAENIKAEVKQDRDESN